MAATRSSFRSRRRPQASRRTASTARAISSTLSARSPRRCPTSDGTTRRVAAEPPPARGIDREEGYVAFRGNRTWYRVVGNRASSRAPLLALHGGPGSTHHYFEPLERLAHERAVVVYDQLGCGSSDRPDDVEWELAVFRDELAAVRQQLGLTRIH